MARRLGSQPAVAHGLAAHCDAIAGPTYAEQRAVESGEIVEIASALGDPALELLGLRLRIVALAEQGLLERVADDVRAFAALAVRLRQPFYGWYVPLWRGSPHTSSGTSRRCADGPRRSSGWPVPRTARTRRSSVTSCGSGTTWSRAAVPTAMGALLDQLAEIPEAPSGRRQHARRSSRASPTTCGGGRRRRSVGWSGTSSSTPSGSRTSASRRRRSWSCWEQGEPSRVLYDLLRPHAHRFAVDGIAAGFHGSVERYLGSLAWLAGGSRAGRRTGTSSGPSRRTSGPARSWPPPTRDGPMLPCSSIALSRATPSGPAQPARRGRRRLRADGSARTASRRSAGWRSVAASAPAPASRRRGPDEAVFRRSGEVWEVAFRGRRSTVRDSKGMRDLAVLLARPGDRGARARPRQRRRVGPPRGRPRRGCSTRPHAPHTGAGSASSTRRSPTPRTSATPTPRTGPGPNARRSSRS